MKELAMSPRFEGLNHRLQRWLIYEQTVNERLLNLAKYRPIESRLPRHLRPEAQAVWNQEVVWLPRELARCYGPVEAELRGAFGIDSPKDCTALCLHPQPPAAHRRLARAFGRERLPGIAATPTSSYRSVVTWSRNGNRSPILLKLSLGAIVGKIRRAFREEQIARAVVISALFDAIPMADRERLRFDCFSEPAGVAETQSGHGWLLRRFPLCLSQSGTTTAIPVCSLISCREKQPPLLVELIKRAKQTPEAFVAERLLRPYVNALAYLLFEQGLQFEGHSQNVLVEIGEDDALTGRVLLRDLSDSFVNIPLRVAKGQPLPVFPRGFLPGGAPFSVVMNAYCNRYDRPVLVRGYDTVEHFGLWAFVWPINASLERFFRGYDSRLLETRYLELWQQAAIKYLGLRPLFRRQPRGIATDETITHFLTQTDWRALGAVRAQLPDTAVPLRIDRRMRRRVGQIYDRLECPWGDLFIMDGLPGFLRPAF